MANVEHSTLTGSDLHEPKAIAAAAANRVYVSNGAGSGTWTTVSNDLLAASAKAFQAQLLHVQDQKAQGTAGGTSVNGGTRDLNTILTNEISGSSLASNQITLPAGTYYIEASVPAFFSNNHKAFLFNVTDSGNQIHGTCEYAPSTNATLSRSLITGRFTIVSSKVFEIRHTIATTRVGDGFGIAAGTGVEVYTDVRIWKVG